LLVMLVVRCGDLKKYSARQLGFEGEQKNIMGHNGEI